MRDVTLFGSKAFPLRASALQKIVLCPWRAASMFLFDPEDHAGPAADVGSAAHAAIAEWHRTGSPEKSIQHMIEERSHYPLADLDEAAGLFLSYRQDPENSVNLAHDSVGLILERRIDFELEPVPEDPTQAPIFVKGTLDQVRLELGSKRLWDIKTSKRKGHHLLAEHQYQAAAYCYGATKLLGEPVLPGGLILPRAYRPGSTIGVRWEFSWTITDISQILLGVRRTVAAIRAGRFHHMPSEGCDWCHYHTPDVCLPELRSIMTGLEKNTPLGIVQDKYEDMR